MGGYSGDTLGQILFTVRREARRLHLGELDEDLVRQYVDLGLVAAVKKGFPHVTSPQHSLLLQAVQQALASRPMEVFLNPGAKETVERIHAAGLLLGIATNKGEHSLKRALQSCGLETLFHVTRSAGQVPAKPCPDMLQEIMDVCGVTASQTLMVGDTVTDVEMAKYAKVDAMGVDFYHQQGDALRQAGAIDVLDDYRKLLEFLGLS